MTDPAKTALLSKTTNLQTLLTLFTTTLSTTTTTTNPAPAPTNPLPLLRDAATLLKAQTTKLSLLLLNAPFTPTAVTKVLQECEAQALPAMMGAVQSCRGEIWGGVMEREVSVRVGDVMGAFGEMVGDVRRKVEAEGAGVGVKAVAVAGKAGKAEKEGEEGEREKILASTGMVWGACEGLIELEKMGVVGLTLRKVNEYRDTLSDAIAELREWGEDEEDLDEGFGGSEEGVGGDADDVEDMFTAANKLPSHRGDLRELLGEALRQLKLVEMLYKAVAKRRIQTFPTTSPLESEEALTRMKTLDEVVGLLKSIPESVDDLANAFYELDVEEATSLLTTIASDANAAAAKVEKSWADAPDEFTTWRSKFEEALSKKPVKEEEKAKQIGILPIRSKR